MSANPNAPGGNQLSPGAANYLNQLTGGGGAYGAIVGAAHDIAPPPWQRSRVAVTGTPFDTSLGLPTWLDAEEVQRAAAAAAVHGDRYDPYFGVISHGEISTGAAVYWGRGKQVRVETGKVSYTHNERMIKGELVNTPTVVRETTSKIGDKHLTVSAALNQPYMWSEDEQRNQLNHAVQLGLLKPGATFDDYVSSVWTGAVWRAAKTYDASQGQRKVTPFDVIDMYGKELAATDATAPKPFTGDKTTTSRSVNQLTEGEAWSALRNALAAQLGRDPSDRELRNFTYKMNTLAARNPSVTKTTTHYKDGEAVSADSTSRGGFSAADAEQAAYNQAQSSPEYGAVQSATTYYNALQSALGSIGNVGSN